MQVRGYTIKSIGLVGLLLAGGAQGGTTGIEASGPQHVTLSLYDQGFALVSELRRITPVEGANLIRFEGLPVDLDPAAISFVPVAVDAGIEVHEQRYAHDARDSATLFRRALGKTVIVHSGGTSYTGALLHVDAPDGDGIASVLIEDGAGTRLWIDQHSIEHVRVPDARTQFQLDPVLIWQADVDREGPQNIRLTYRLDDLHWAAAYDVVLAEDGETAHFSGRIGLNNRTDALFQEATVHLVTTERGGVQHQRARRAARTIPSERAAHAPPLRYAYGESDLVFEEAVAGPMPVHTYRLSRLINLVGRDTVFVQYARAPQVPVSRFYVYDGVRFDRFQTYRRNDWNYGTESHEVVETHLAFVNESAAGLGIELPPGSFRLYQRMRDGTVEFIGEDRLPPLSVGASGHARLGAARGLRGQRERTHYTEITPMRVYEESFQISLENNTEETVEIRVVERLYRWPEYEIVRADAEYEPTGEQRIEFRPVLRPGGRRTIHYTVRYTW